MRRIMRGGHGKGLDGRAELWDLAGVARREPFLHALLRPLRAAAIIACHFLVGALMLLGLYWSDQWFHWLWGDEEPKFFEWIPVKWLFHASELGVMVAFVVSGGVDMIKELRR